MDTKKQQGCLGNQVFGLPVTKVQNLEMIFLHSLTAFGGKDLQAVYQVLATIRDRGIPLVLAIAGPITISDQHRASIIPLLESGMVACIVTTDAVCYHDGHDCLHPGFRHDRPIREAPLHGFDREMREAGEIRITNTGFKEELLYDQDKMISAILSRPEFQRKMTTAERNYLLGAYYAAQEEKNQIRPGLLSTCYRLGIPVFIGAPGDGSAFLNAMKLKALSDLGLLDFDFRFEVDVYQDVLDTCALHYYLNRIHMAKAMGIFILGGGVPKNYALQPEPALSQIFGLPVDGYAFDCQIVSAPVTDGSLSSCYPSEAHTWGKVQDILKTASLQGDYSTYLPFIVRALLEGMRKPEKQLRLMDRLDEMRGHLREAIRENQGWIKKTLDFPLARP